MLIVKINEEGPWWPQSRRVDMNENVSSNQGEDLQEVNDDNMRPILEEDNDANPNHEEDFDQG